MHSATAAPNPHAHAARARKVLALVSTFDRALTECGYATGSAHAAHLAAVQSPESWARVAVLAGCRPPSPATVRDIVAVYQARVPVTEVA